LSKMEISGYPRSVKKILVSIDDRLLARIDKAARAAGLSRSAYLAELAARGVGAERPADERRRIQEAVRRLRRLARTHGTAEDATAAVRAARDAR
jgi:metal-responsive CopG/Arc/MetJ family transcriptional regulator